MENLTEEPSMSRILGLSSEIIKDGTRSEVPCDSIQSKNKIKKKQTERLRRDECLPTSAYDTNVAFPQEASATYHLTLKLLRKLRAAMKHLLGSLSCTLKKERHRQSDRRKPALQFLALMETELSRPPIFSVVASVIVQGYSAPT